ncbi:MAG: prolyl oligopeptidase family serine peptidase [Elusimicrobia bacterium]|nr:prolyl oligopeptidase family serine peptidase [Elusimicrobiota bacterium]
MNRRITSLTCAVFAALAAGPAAVRADPLAAPAGTHPDPHLGRNAARCPAHHDPLHPQRKEHRRRRPGERPRDESPELRLNSRIHVTREVPPTFLLRAEDDHVDHVEQILTYYAALKKADVPVEMHLYAGGGHAFGLRPTKFPITRWPPLVETWLRTIGMVSE